jgi:hypothetical protein
LTKESVWLDTFRKYFLERVSANVRARPSYWSYCKLTLNQATSCNSLLTFPLLIGFSSTHLEQRPASMRMNRIHFLAVLFQVSTPPCLRAAEPWDVPFASGTQSILDAAKRLPIPDSQPVLILLEQHHITIDDSPAQIGERVLQLLAQRTSSPLSGGWIR